MSCAEVQARRVEFTPSPSDVMRYAKNTFLYIILHGISMQDVSTLLSCEIGSVLSGEGI